MLRAWLAPLEGWLAKYADGPQGCASLPPQHRLALIDADLADPALAGLRGDDAGPQNEHRWPANASAAYRWGVCYVIEGSQLGGAVLHQRLAAALAPHRLRYLKGEQEGPGPRWRQFMLALDAQVRSEEEIAQACHGACDAFDSMLACAGQAVVS